VNMFKINKILIATDFSKFSLTAADYALSLAADYDAEVHLIHVIEKTPPILTIRSLDLSQEKILQEIEEEAKSALKHTLQQVKKINDKVKIVSVLRKGIDYEEIINYSVEAKIDLIVIATHGRTGLLHTLIGSVAEKVIRYSKIPVLVTTPSAH
jgi:nucleotide-binding universal stress UspA family protein